MQKLLIEARGLRVSFGDRVVLDIDRLAIYDGEVIGLVGENGAGKTTLLSILAGDAVPHAGSVQRYCPAAVIRQGGTAADAGDARFVSEFRAPSASDSLSGGELTRRRIAQALSEDAPLLLADEPTADLDAGGVERLEKRLHEREGAMLLISHDRSLLNALCTRIWHLEDGHIADFPGSYDDYLAELERRRAFQQFEYDQYRAETGRLKALAQRQAEWAASVKKAPKRMGNSEARLHTHEYTNSVLRLSHAKKTIEGRMQRLEKKERPRDLPQIRMALGALYPIAAKVACEAEVKSLCAGGKALLRDARLHLPTGSRTALCGDNGCGKTTLLHCLLGQDAPGVAFEGRVRLNPAARVGTFDQDHAKALDFDASVLQNAMARTTLPESEVRTVLARLGLRGNQVFKPVSALSGGERAKVALAKLLVGEYNLLVLDEPTNYLDVFTLEALQALLQGYGGTLLFVSHDRAFAEAVATRLVHFEGTALRTVEGGFDRLMAEEGRDKSAEALSLQISAIEMRMAALAARISTPKKGDRPQLMNEEYDRLAAELRRLKQGN